MSGQDPKTLVGQFVESQEGARLFQQERAIYEITELIEQRMKENGISRSQLAEKLGKTKVWVAQLLDGEANKTIRTVADVFSVLGRSLHFCDGPITLESSMNDLYESVIDSIENHLREMQTPGYASAAEATGSTRERLAAEGIFHMFTTEFRHKILGIKELRERVAQLEGAIKAIDRCLRVPAAEYVPAMADAFKIIDGARAN